MLTDAILVSANTRTHSHSLSLSLCYLALPSSIYKALRRHNLNQSKYTFLRIKSYHFKGYTYIKPSCTILRDVRLSISILSDILHCVVMLIVISRSVI